MIKHYKQLFNSSPLEACKGCILNETESTNICLFEQDKNQLIEIPVKQSQISTIQHLPVQGMWPRLKMSPHSILYYFNSKIHQNTTNINLPSNIQIHMDPISEAKRFIRKHINTSEDKLQELTDIKLTIANLTYITIHTDGSLQNNKMGIGWVLKTEDQDLTFQARTSQTFPSSTRAELLAILSSLITIPSNTTVELYTDSQAAINSIHTYLLKNRNKQKKHLKNQITLDNIQQIIKILNIQLNLHKVKAHSGNTDNKKADSLAKQAINTLQIHQIVDNNITFIDKKIIPTWNNIALEKPLPEIIKTIQRAKSITQWRLLNRTRQWLDHRKTQSIDWAKTFNNLHPSKITNHITSEADHTIRSFKLRLWNNKLPTKNKLHNRCKTIYQDNKCHICNQEETNTHPFFCSIQAAKTASAIKDIMNREISTKLIHPENRKTINKHLLKYVNISDQNTLTEITKGIVHKKLTTTVKEFVSTDEVNKCIQNIYQAITEYCIQVWHNRCESFIKWEKTVGICNKVKKQIRYDKQTVTSDIVKDCYPYIINKYIENHIRYAHDIYKALSVDYSVGKALVN
jgi:ribonuclease HI